MKSRRPGRVSDLHSGWLWLLLLAGMLLAGGCRQASRQPARKADTTRSGGLSSSPGPSRAGINDYNRQREALGDLDSLVTPAQPAAPRQ